MKEAILYEKMGQNMVRCGVCEHCCAIREDGLGICRTRKNVAGKLYSLVYGDVIAAHVDPIEKKPLYHFLPGSLAYSIATAGCNFRCLHCQNYEISQASQLVSKSVSQESKIQNPTPHLMRGKIQNQPSRIIKTAIKNKCQSIAYTYTEPTVFVEYALDVMKLAKENGLKNVWVSNGYYTPQTFETILPYLDAINIDLKFITEADYQKVCGAELGPVLRNIENCFKNNVHLEVTTLIIPSINDQAAYLKKIADFLVRTSLDIPWHISAFHPAFKLSYLPATSDSILEKAYHIAKNAGLNYVYLGNTTLNLGQDTRCPACDELLIERSSFSLKTHLKNNLCPRCGVLIPGVFQQLTNDSVKI